MSTLSFVGRFVLAVVWMMRPASLWAGEAIKPFVDVTEAMGLKGNNGGVAAWGDYDNDGWVDLCIGGEIWHNEQGKRFTRVGRVGGPAIWGDLDNDGHLDLFVGNFSHPPDYQDRSQFLRNMGPKKNWKFEDMTRIAKLRWQESYASPTLGDFHNDGWLDLYFTTVYPGDKSVLYRNLGNWKFEEIKNGAGLSLPQTYQAAWADFNNDGHLDLMTGGRLFRNPGNSNHWLKVRLEGAGKVNRAAIGAQVRLRLDKHTLTRQVEGATGQGNQNDLTLHFGLGAHKGPVRLEIRWPDGTRQEVDTPVDRTLTVKRAK
jgi:hypothetical protein